MVTVTKKDLVALGYGNSFATDIIRLAKEFAWLRRAIPSTPHASSTAFRRKPSRSFLGLP